MTKHATGVGGKTDRFLQLMDDHNLKPEQVAQLTGRALKTVYGWRLGKPHAIPSPILKLLEIELASSQPSPSRGGQDVEITV